MAAAAAVTRRRTKKWAAIAIALVLAAGSVMLAVPSSSAATGTWMLDDQARPPTDPDRDPVELGVRFVPKTAGTITAIRFYKPRQARGPFTARLWDDRGRALAKTGFERLTAEGWQTAELPAPVTVTAGREYTVSYTAPKGRYAATENYFTSARETAHATLPRGAGAYTYQPGTFPTGNYADSNYWVDALFTPATTPTLTASPTSQPTTTPTATPESTATPTVTPPTGPGPNQWPGTGLPTDTFPMLVWLQSPADGNATFWADLGVTGFFGLWRWPDDADKFPGWASSALEGMKANGQYAYAGETPDALRKTLGMADNDRVAGWLAGDEPDMFGPNPQEWNANIDAMLAVQDRPMAANFGLGFGGFDWWYDHISDADRAEWCRQVDVPAVDYYGMTSPNNPTNQMGAWTYGRGIDNLRKACGDTKPLGVFVETTEITTGAKTATPEDIRAAAWNGIIHGADHVDLFVHDFDCNPECGESMFMIDPKYASQRQAVKDLSAELNRWNTVLRTPDITGTQVSGIPLHTLTKRHDGKTYVFAQSAGDATRIEGYAGQATITINGQTFTDDWTPNQIRVYEQG